MFDRNKLAIADDLQEKGIVHYAGVISDWNVLIAYHIVVNLLTR